MIFMHPSNVVFQILNFLILDLTLLLNMKQLSLNIVQIIETGGQLFFKVCLILFELHDILLVIVFNLGDLFIFFSEDFITIQLYLGNRLLEFSLINISISSLFEQLFSERFNTDILL